MFVFWGTSDTKEHHHNVVLRFCPTCGKEQLLDIVAEKLDVDLYSLVEFNVKAKYSFLCSVCGKGWELKPERAIELIRDAKERSEKS